MGRLLRKVCANLVLWFSVQGLAESENSMRIKHNLGNEREVLRQIFIRLPKLAILSEKCLMTVVYL